MAFVFFVLFCFALLNLVLNQIGLLVVLNLSLLFGISTSVLNKPWRKALPHLKLPTYPGLCPDYLILLTSCSRLERATHRQRKNWLALQRQLAGKVKSQSRFKSTEKHTVSRS